MSVVDVEKIPENDVHFFILNHVRMSLGRQYGTFKRRLKKTLQQLSFWILSGCLLNARQRR